ncbi:hypothetical protein I3843_09G125000 [Carya illinoinensis]|uniref:uncharacterized protein LOC122275513 isoform X1 n=1 Tax=Carya illinoinensis TaxID=32201 RepID=UPI001C71CC84|nr:uncharacterized protein LOC122275513 isoform X1 [Carya illinoinensis]KAG7963586.1 hypothetical protein I3843_09G125000 [Carya illinoinensis]
MDSESLVGFDELKLDELITKGSLDFDEWASLISHTEKNYPDDIEKICSVYDSFLSEFPLCYGYWRKYADHKTRLCTIDKVFEIFERAVQSATYSVGMWVDYCSFSMSAFEDPSDIRRLFQRGISFVGKDYLCHALWDKYIQFEFSQQQWSSLAHICIQTLRFPTKRLNHYYDRFKKLVASWGEKMEFPSISAGEESPAEPVLDSKAPIWFKNEEISCIIKDLLDPTAGFAKSKALQKYLLMGELFYKEACQLNEKICCFEANIRRSYFHVKPLDSSQLENWHHYLDFVEMQGDFDWAVKLYERCLIPCANYPEFWMRYVEFMETKGGREIANHAMDRATLNFLKRVPVIHLFNSRFKEQIGDTSGARASLQQCESESASNFVENVKLKANMEKRMGNFDAASNVYKEAIEMAATKKMFHTLPILYIHFSRHVYVRTGSADAARDVLVDGVKHVPHCKLLIEELINFTMMHEGPKHRNVVESVIADAISSGLSVSQGLNAKDAEDISSLYLEFVDHCGTIHDLRRAWNRHIRLFPHSLRIAPYRHPATGTKTLEPAKEGREETSVAKSCQPSGDSCSNLLIQLSLQEKKLSPSGNRDNTQCDHAPTKVVEQKLPSLENDDNRFELVTICQHLSGESDSNVQEIVKQSSPEDLECTRDDTAEADVPPGDVAQEQLVSPEIPDQHRRETPEDSKQHREYAYKLNASSVDLISYIAYETECVQDSHEYLREYDVQEQCGHESEQDLKQPLLENLSLVTQKDRSPVSVPSTSHRCEAPEETCVLHGSLLESSCDASPDGSLCSPLGSQASARSGMEAVNPSSSSNQQNLTPAQALKQPQVPANTGGNWRQNNNTDRIHRQSKFGVRGHSQRKLHQKRQNSPQQYPRAEMDSQTPINQGYSNQPLPSHNAQVQQSGEAQNQYQAAAAHANLTTHMWPMQNVLQQNFATASESQLPAPHVALQTSQYSMQNSQEYNQAWQYYYYQQHQFLLQQPNQQLMQQQYQQQLQLQQHYQQQQQQLQHLQQQQLQYNQQQQFQMQHQQFLPQQQQHQLYVQQQPQPLQQQQQELEQKEHQQQSTPSEVEA